MLVLSAALMNTGAFAKQVGDWNFDTVQGFEKYWTQNEEGARFTIWCHRKRNLSGTVLDIDIAGRNAPAKRNMRVVIDRKLFRFRADNRGYVQTGCPACADNYTVLWRRLSNGVRLAVEFDDSRFAAFSLNGAREILQGDVCPPDYLK